ncbi:hypothetical protein D0863_07838, partial [Hortaea werneckii]
AERIRSTTRSPRRSRPRRTRTTRLSRPSRLLTRRREKRWPRRLAGRDLLLPGVSRRAARNKRRAI